MICKPRSESYSFGVHLCQNEAELRAAIAFNREATRRAPIVEAFVPGLELQVPVLSGTTRLAPVAIALDPPDPPLVLWEDKMGNSGRFGHVCPAPISEEQTKTTVRVAREAAAVLELDDYARVDVRLSSDGRPIILEVNSMPSLARSSAFNQAAFAVGLDYPLLLGRILQSTLRRQPLTVSAT